MCRRDSIRPWIGLLAVGAVLGLAAVPAAAQPWSFTTCGQTGRTGPSQGQCDTAYSGTDLDGAVTVNGGIQEWTVPTTGTYRIEAVGSAAGTQTFSPGFPGGRGASIAGDFELTAGQTLFVIVGQMGEDTRAALDNAAPGGGGGSFVYFDANDAEPLIAAGGGGSGSSCEATPTADQDANTGTAGNDSGSLANGGTGGNGGTNNVGGDSYWAGGGAGWLTDGTGGNNSTDFDFTPGDEGAEGGRAPRNGALGGIRWNDGLDEGGDGGFGGGGGGGSDNMGGGGGGGFSGGGGARWDPCGNEPGGGGGSFNGGANPVNLAAASTGDGSVVISLAAVPALPKSALLLLLAALAVVGYLILRRS